MMLLSLASCTTVLFLWSEYLIPVCSLKEFSLARYSDTAVYANNSEIDINLVGEGFKGPQVTDGGALECHTDDTTCCRGIDNPPNGTGRGEWYYPDGTVIPPPGGSGIYRTRDHMVVRLNREPGMVLQFGMYRCEIPDAGGVTIIRKILLHPTVRCQDIAEFTNRTITYIPPRDVSGNLPAGQRYTGTIVTYSCSPGYQLVGGSSLRACSPDGTWNGTELSCQAYIVADCGPLSNPDNGQVDTSNGTTFGSTATYTCDTGYTLSGSESRSCGVDGNWTQTMPCCDAVDCGNLTPLTNGEVDISNGTTFGSVAIFSCNTGYLLSHQKVVKCGADGMWSPVSPSCLDDSDITSSTSSSSPITTADDSDITSSTSSSSPITTAGTKSPDVGTSPNIAGPAAGAVVGVLAVVLLIILVIIVAVVLKRRTKSVGEDRYKHPETELKESSKLSIDRSEDHNGVTKKEDLKAPSIVEFPSDIQSTEGVMVHLRVRVSGHPTPTINWYHDGVAVRADYSREIDEHGGLMFPSVEKAHSGSYKLMVANSSGRAEKEVIVSVGCDGGEGGGSGDTTKAVPVSEFGVYVAQHHAQGNKMFTQVYQSLDSGDRGHNITVAVSKENKPANRFKNITVYDDNRVVLQPISGEADCQTDYINASYIDGYSVSSKFIASQGPLPHTVIDFWRMVWQGRPSAIVMLTNCEEGGRVKCEQYWPESGNKNYGPFQVIITDKQILADYTVRSFVVTNIASKDGKSLKLTQFHFTAWPDHGVPEYATPILAFLRRIRAHHVPLTGPLIVHCSAGVGRTGTYITLDNVFDQIKAEGLVDIDGVIIKARKQRMKMVQTKDQYIFIHDAILEFLTCGDTQISSMNFRMAISKLKQKNPDHKCTGYQHQFNVLDQVSPNPTEVNCSTALKHPDKNRGNKYLPVENSRIILIGEQPDYIHAVAANGYKHRKAYIIAQNPLKSTVRNFWKVIADRKCAAIVMLSKLKESKKEACAVYWPEEGGAGYGEFKVDIIGKEEFPEFIMRKLVVSNFKTHQSHQVTQFHVTNWSPDGTCSNLKVLTDVIEEVAKVQRRTGNNPILVHCSDTVSRSGMFCAIATTIDRCKTEGVVDVFQVVKALRIHKPGAVLNVEQYKLVHEAVLTFLESFDSYANFQAV